MRKGLYIVLSVVALYLVLPINTVSAQATEALFSGGDDGIIYRCAASAGCDTGATDWSAVLNTSGDIIQDIILDTTNNVLYANNVLTFGGGSIVYRCPTSTGCDTSGEWTATFSGTAAGDNLYEMGYDATNSVLS